MFYLVSISVTSVQILESNYPHMLWSPPAVLYFCITFLSFLAPSEASWWHQRPWVIRSHPLGTQIWASTCRDISIRIEGGGRTARAWRSCRQSDTRPTGSDSAPAEYKCQCGGQRKHSCGRWRLSVDPSTPPTVNLVAECWGWWSSLCHVLRVGAILAAHRWSTVTNHIISCLSTHSHLFSSRLMVKWRKNQWLPLVRKSQLCHVWEFDVAPSYSPRDGKLKAEFEQADRREQTGVSQVDIMTDFNLLLLVARLSLLPLKKKEEKKLFKNQWRRSLCSGGISTKW